MSACPRMPVVVADVLLGYRDDSARVRQSCAAASDTVRCLLVATTPRVDRNADGSLHEASYQGNRDREVAMAFTANLYPPSWPRRAMGDGMMSPWGTRESSSTVTECSSTASASRLPSTSRFFPRLAGI